MKAKSGTRLEPPRLHLPDFCAPRAVFTVVLIVELTALTLSLARGGERGEGGAAFWPDFWSDFGGAALFLLWVGLCGAGILCRLRGWLARQSVARATTAVLGLIAGVIGIISALAHELSRLYLFGPEPRGWILPPDGVAFMVRNMLIGLVVSAMALRYFYVAQQWRRNVELQAHARVNLLQARIRPHFLFNSMNSIASLTRSDPARAEEAVQDLADLFRATLSENRREIPLQDEIEIARTYQRIEQLRLGERLRVAWHVDSLPPQALVPGLTLQPLLENAIYHGIDPLPLGGGVSITGECVHGLITLVVRNPVAPLEHGAGSTVPRSGNRLALANIRERLELMYGERATLKAGRFDAEFVVTLRFPHIETAARLRA